MKKNIVAAIIAVAVVCTSASGILGYAIGGKNARAAAAIEKSMEIEELQAENDGVLAEMRTEKINAILGERDAKKAAADQKAAKLNAESKKAAVDRAAKELKKEAETANANKKAAEGQLADMKTAKEKAEADKKASETNAANEKAAKEKAEADKKAAEQKLSDELARRDAEQKDKETRKQLAAQKKAEIMNAIVSAKADGTITEDEAASIRGMVNDARAQHLVVTFTYGDLDSMNLSLEELKGLRINVVDEEI